MSDEYVPSDDAIEIACALTQLWPGPPVWNEERTEAYCQAFDAARLPVKAYSRALEEMRAGDLRPFAPAPFELVQAATASYERIAREQRTKRLELDSGDYEMPSIWPTDMPCPQCGEKVWFNRKPAYLYCRDCKSVIVQDQEEWPDGAQQAQHYSHRERYEMNTLESGRVKTAPPLVPDWADHHPGRVIAAWLRAGGTGGQLDNLSTQEKLTRINEQLSATARSYDPATLLLQDMSLEQLQAELAKGSADPQRMTELRVEIQKRHTANRPGGRWRSAEEVLGQMFDQMADRDLMSEAKDAIESDGGDLPVM